MTVKVHFNFQIVQENLFLFSNSDAGFTFDLFNFVEAHVGIVFLDKEFAEFSGEVLFGEGGVLLLLVEPVVVVPDGPNTLPLWLRLTLHFLVQI